MAANYKLQVRINGVESDWKSLIQTSDINTYYHTKNGYLLSDVMVLPFCLDTSSYDPTGTLNFSRLDTFEIVTPGGVTLRQLLNTDTLYAVGYNILDIRDGTCTLLYSD